MRVLFVCTGNICRSPAAHAVLAAHAARARLAVEVDSAGTGAWHAGELPDERARAEGARRGYTLTHRARAVRPADFQTFDLVVAMDRTHLRALIALAPPAARDRVVLFRAFDPEPGEPDVSDPYYEGADAFVEMFNVIEDAMPALLAHLAGGAGPEAR
jgi:protein-tyrosine phosphatase